MKFPLGYIGVGLMGGPMVKRLTARGWQVMAYDIVPERSAVSSVADAVRGADVVLLNLPTNDAVLDLLGKLTPAMKAPQLVVDFSTIPVDACLDAPVSGGPPAVEAATLTVMAGAKRRTWSAWRPS